MFLKPTTLNIGISGECYHATVFTLWLGIGIRKNNTHLEALRPKVRSEHSEEFIDLQNSFFVGVYICDCTRDCLFKI